MQVTPQQDRDYNVRIRQLLSSPNVLAVIHKALLFQPATVSSDLSLPALAEDNDTRPNVKFLVLELLDVKGRLSKLYVDPVWTIANISSVMDDLPVNALIARLLAIVDAFSLPCYRVAVAFLSIQSQNEGVTQESIASAVLEGARFAISRCCKFWPSLLACLNDTVKAEVSRTMSNFANLCLQ